MKVLILSGFLGAGKTTFLQELVKNLKNVVILENDYARDVDRELLSNEDNLTYAIDEGCACCTRGEELENAVLSIANTVDPEYLIIEPTGLCSLSALIKRIKKVEYERIQYIGSIAILEMTRYKKIEADYPDLYVDSLQNANYIILSKSEEADRVAFSEAAQHFAVHTASKVADKHYSRFEETDWQTLIEALKPLSQVKESDYHYHAMTLAYDSVAFDNANQMGTCFNALLAGRFGKIMRAKGGIKMNGKYYRIDIVDDQFGFQLVDKPISNLVFIGKDLDQAAFSVFFEKHYTEKPCQILKTY